MSDTAFIIIMSSGQDILAYTWEVFKNPTRLLSRFQHLTLNNFKYVWMIH